MDKKSLETIGKLYDFIERGYSIKMEGYIKEGKVTAYSMGKDNPVIRIDIKRGDQLETK